MTAQTRTNLKQSFQQGDKPQESDYTDMIDSFVSLSDSADQTVTSKLTISGGVATTTVSAATLYGDTVILNVTTTVAATVGSGGKVPASAATFFLVTVGGTIYRVPAFPNSG